MEKNDKKDNVFKSKFAEDYIIFNDMLTRYSVTGIAASCEMLGEFVAKKGTRNEKRLISNIMSMCCELMKNSELSRVLISPGDDGIWLNSMPANAFFRDFAVNCEKASAGKCTVTVKECSERLIRTDLNLLRYLLLGFIRKYALANGAEKSEFEASCEVTGENVIIHLTAAGTFVDSENILRPDIFDKYSDDVTEGIAARLGAEAKLEENGIHAVIPLAEGKAGAVIESPAAGFEDRMFTLFDLMLSDLPR